MKQIDKLIINSPYEEPKCYWHYDREHRSFERREGRRPAGYVVATPDSKGFDDPGDGGEFGDFRAALYIYRFEIMIFLCVKAKSLLCY